MMFKGLKKIFGFPFAAAMALIVLAFAAYLVAADTYTFTVNSPTPNATEYYTRSVLFNVTINDTNVRNVSYSLDSGAVAYMLNMTGVVWNNLTNIQLDGYNNQLHNIIFYANDTYLNQSTATAQYFSVNEFARMNVNISETQGVINAGEFYDRSVPLIVSTNATVSACTGYVDTTNGVTFKYSFAMENQTNRQTYRNASSITPQLYNVTNGGWHNATFSCQDAFGNTTWYNRTTIPNNTANMVIFKINEFQPLGVNLNATRYIINGTEFFGKNAELAVIGNATVSACNAYVDTTNGVTFASTYALGNLTTRTVYRNTTTVTPFATSNNGWHNVTFMCQDAFGNQTWLNRTGLPTTQANTVMFKINEFVTDGVNITDIYPNQTIFNKNIRVNVTTNRTAAIGRWFYNGTQVNLRNATTAYNTFENATYVTVGQNTYGNYIKLEYYVEDVYGNRSWSNATTRNITTFIRVDLAAPTVGYLNSTVSVDGLNNYINSTFNVTDANPNAPFLRAIYADQTSYLSANGTWKVSGATGTGAVNLTSLNLTLDGKYYVQPGAYDDAGWNTTYANETYVVTHLDGGYWTPLSWYKNVSLEDIGRLVPNATHVAIYNNTFGNKSFVTYTLGLAANKREIINATMTPVMVRVDSDVTLIRKLHDEGNRQEINITLWAGMNLISVVNEVSLNATVFREVFMNSTYVTTGGSSVNITSVGLYNTSTGTYCSMFRGYTATSCRGLAGSIVAKAGTAIWINSQANMTMKRDGM